MASCGNGWLVALVEVGRECKWGWMTVDGCGEGGGSGWLACCLVDGDGRGSNS